MVVEWWPLPARKPWKIGSNNWCLGDEIVSWMFIWSPERSGLVLWIMSMLRYSKNKKTYYIILYISYIYILHSRYTVLYLHILYDTKLKVQTPLIIPVIIPSSLHGDVRKVSWKRRRKNSRNWPASCRSRQMVEHITGWWWLEPWNFDDFPFSWEWNHHPNWLSLHHFSEG